MKENTVIVICFVVLGLMLIGIIAFLFIQSRKIYQIFRTAKAESTIDKLKMILKSRQYHNSQVISFFGGEKGIIRHLDGGYVAAWHLNVGNTLEMPEHRLNNYYAQLASLIGRSDRKGIVYQIRGVTHIDTGEKLYEWSKQTQPAAGVVNREARIHSDKSSTILWEMLKTGELKTRKIMLFVKYPGTLKSDRKGLTLGQFFKIVVRNFSVKDFVASFSNSVRLWNSKLVSRLANEELEMQEEVQKFFEQITREIPFPAERTTGTQLERMIFLGHNEREVSVPDLSKTSDVRDYLGKETISCTDTLIWHGNTPVGLISLTKPLGNEGMTECGIMRLLELNSSFRFRMTTIFEGIPLSDKEALKKINSNLTRIERKLDYDKQKGKAAKEDVRLEKSFKKLRELKRTLGNPATRLVQTRVSFLVYAPPVSSKEQVEKAMEFLEEACNGLIAQIRKFGGDAIRETDVALPALYPNLLPGELSSETTGREIDSDSFNAVALAPIEDNWQGIGIGRNETWMVNNNSNLVPFTIYRPEGTESPTVSIVASAGGGKSFLMDKLSRNFLSFFEDSKVVGADYNNNGRLCELLGGKIIKFDPQDKSERPLTLNVWYYPGLENGEMPDQSQIAMVSKEVALLCGYRKGETDRFTNKMALIRELVIKTYEREVPKNQPEYESYHEPKLRHLYTVTENYPTEQLEEMQKTELSDIKLLLKGWRGNKWLDADISPALKEECKYLIFDLQSVGKFPEEMQEILAFRVTANVLNADLKRKGKTVKRFDEMHQYKKFPSILEAIELIANTDRKTGGILLLGGHRYSDLGKTVENSCLIIAGKQDETVMKDTQGNDTNFSLLCKSMRLSDNAKESLSGIRNYPGIFTSFLVSVKSDDPGNLGFIRNHTSPYEFWSIANGTEENAAYESVKSIMGEYWSDDQMVQWLAINYPNGLEKNKQINITELIAERQSLDEGFEQMKDLVFPQNKAKEAELLRV